MIKREKYINKLIEFKDKDFIKALTGVRRSGKSYILMMYKDYLIDSGISEDNIIYINFESLDYQNVRGEKELLELIKSLDIKKKEKYYFLFDEIQFVDNWYKVINGLRVSYNSDIVITGSNAKMLSGELATYLSGRYVQINIYPLSFNEFLDFKNIDKDSRLVDSMYLEYEKYGGFPSVVLANENIKDTILSGIFDSIVLNDVAFRSGIKDTDILKNIVRFLADNVGQLVNPNNISNMLKSQNIKVSTHTVLRYIELLENAFLFYRSKQYDLRGKSYLKVNSKLFIADNGLRRYAIGLKESNYSNRLENIVYLELLRRGYTVDVGRIDGKEIDFIARKIDKIKYIQVTYEIPKSSRESDNLLLINDNFEKIIITGRYYDQKYIDGIKVKYIVDWLLEE